MKTCVVHIKAGTAAQIPVIITKPNTTLSWEFVSKYYDIDYRITKVAKEDKIEIVIPTTHCPGKVIQKGMVVVKESGTYYLEWDNHRSWMREKTVEYSYTLKMPSLTIEEKVMCSKWVWVNETIDRMVLTEMAKLQLQIDELDQIIEEKEKELSTLRIIENGNEEKKKVIKVVSHSISLSLVCDCSFE